MLKDIAEDFKQYSDKQSEALVGVKTALATKKKAALENSVRYATSRGCNKDVALTLNRLLTGKRQGRL